MAKKHIIWQENIDLKDWDAEFFEHIGLGEDADEDAKYRAAYEMNAEYRNDEYGNLSYNLPGRVICIADLGLWNGRRSGYKLLGRNLNSILNTWTTSLYCDQYNVCGEEAHHDGTNFYTFRLIPDGVDNSRLLDAIYFGEATPAMIRHYTRSLRPYVSRIYGWGGKQIPA